MSFCVPKRLLPHNSSPLVFRSRRLHTDGWKVANASAVNFFETTNIRSTIRLQKNPSQTPSGKARQPVYPTPEYLRPHIKCEYFSVSQMPEDILLFPPLPPFFARCSLQEVPRTFPAFPLPETALPHHRLKEFPFRYIFSRSEQYFFCRIIL